MAICFRRGDVEYRFDEGDPVLVFAVCERANFEHVYGRREVEPFIGEVELIATPGVYFCVRGRGERHRVPFDGFTLLKGFGRRKDTSATGETKEY